MADEEHQFESTESGASETYPMQAGNIRKGGFAILKDHPCKVVEIAISKTGKHGHAKAHLVGLDIFTNKKYDDMCPTSHNMMIPNVTRKEYQLLDIGDDGFLSLLADNGDSKEDLKLPTDTEGNEDDTARQIRAAFADGKDILVTVMSAMNIEKIVSHKVASEK
eukprot:GILK01000107.1.p1 GENE.GILK01000107.1~~GILK01000107.1.p1  ORF type:complete len:185 (+),score=38.54 GILK01000107.1:66-557(+)